MKYDLLLKNGRVVDPSQGLNGITDIGIVRGRIKEINHTLEDTGSLEILDLQGKYVCPGLIDLHGHWYEGSIYGIDPHISLNHGVTTVVDAGTTGFVNFPEFRKQTIDRARIRMLAFLHISCLGLHAPFVEELLDIRYARPKETAVVVERNRDVVVGIKIRLGEMTGNHGAEALELTLEAARTVQLPVMVHISKGANVPQMLGRLRPGDIVTHCFQGRGDGILNCGNQSILEEVYRARKDGVIFDVGHGCGSFSWDTAQRAFELSFYPDTISTDLHRYSVEDPFSVTLLDTLSKFLALGMTLEEVIEKSTFCPAKVLQLENEIGTLRMNSRADILVFEVEEGEFLFADTHSKIRKGTRKLKPFLLIREGKVLKPGACPVNLRQLFESDYEVIHAMRDSSG
jgi:dihydroorotase